MKHKVAVEIDCDGRFCGEDCSFCSENHETGDVCNLFGDQIHYSRKDGKFERCKECIEETDYKTSSSLISFLKGPRVLNGGDLLEWWLPCEDCGGEGFYESSQEKCAKEAWKIGYRVRGDKVYCSECLPKDRKDKATT